MLVRLASCVRSLAREALRQLCCLHGVPPTRQQLGSGDASLSHFYVLSVSPGTTSIAGAFQIG